MGRLSKVFIPITGIVLGIFNGCAGPDLYFDKAPAPAWLNQDSCRLDRSTGKIIVVGSTPATQMIDEDLKLARYDAISKVAQMISSEVTSTTSVWQAESSVGKKTQDRSILSKDVNIRSRIRVADVRVRRRYRDARTKTAYVLIVVDVDAWVSRIEHRLSRYIQVIKGQARTARDLLARTRPLQAYAHILAADRTGSNTASDLAVLSVLQRDNKTGVLLHDLKRKVHSTAGRIKDRLGFSIKIKSSFADAAGLCRGRIRDFLVQKGFHVNRHNRYKIVIRVSIAADYTGRVQVANRSEHVFSAIGSLKVIEPDGSIVGPLSFMVPKGRYSERANNRQAAYKRAMLLGADLVQAGFRSRFRQTLNPRP